MTGVSSGISNSIGIDLDKFVGAAKRAADGQKLTVSGSDVGIRQANSTIGGKLASWIKTNVTGDEVKTNDQNQFRLALTGKHGPAGEKAYQAACEACGFSASSKAHSLTARQVEIALDAIENPSKYEKGPKSDSQLAAEQNKAIIQHFKDHPDLLSKEGLSRKAAKVADVSALVASRNTEGLDEVSTHALAGVLKQNLRDGLTSEDYTKITGFANDFKAAKEAGLNEPKLPALSELPGVVQDAVEFSRMVVEHSGENKMTARNVGIVMGPNINEVNPTDPLRGLDENPKYIDFFVALINDGK